METLFEVDGLCDWKEAYDERDADSITATLIVKTDHLRHVLTFGGLEDNRVLNEVFHGCCGIRVRYDASLSRPYLLEIASRGEKLIPFSATSFGVETRGLKQRG